MPTMRTSPLLACALGCILAVAVLLPAVARGDLSQEEQQGRRIAESLQSGTRECGDLSTGELELVGEYAMGRYLGDSGAHEAMNRRMAEVMGERGERRMHIALGYRYTGCGGGPAWSWTGPMAAMMIGGRGRGGHAYGFGPGMMGGLWHRGGEEGDSFDGAWAAAMLAMMAALIAAVVVGVLWLARRREAPPDRSTGLPRG